MVIHSRGIFFPYRVGEEGGLNKMGGFNYLKERANGDKFKRKIGGEGSL